MRRSRLAARAVALSGLLPEGPLASSPVRAATSLIPVRIAGRPGHAAPYGWGADTTLNGDVGAFGGTGPTLGPLKTPQGLQLTPRGSLYVTEFGHERVQEFKVNS